MRFEEIYEANIDTVYRMCMMYLKNPHDAEEAAQEAFMRYLKYLPSFDNNEHAKRWLIVTSSNICKNMLKSSWFKKMICFEQVPEEYQKEEEDTLLEEIMNLPHKYKTVIYLFYYEGYSSEEISTMLGVNHSTIRSNLHRARKMLKLKIEEVEEFER